MKNNIKYLAKKALGINPDRASTNAPSFYQHLPKKIEVLFDIGAHTGSFTKAFTSNIQVEKAYLFEPIPHLYSIIASDSALKHHSCHKIAFSSISGEAAFYINENEQTSSLLSFDENLKETNNIDKSVKQKIVINTDTLSDFMKRENLSKIDFLKIDAQGADLDILKGGSEILPHVKAIYVEVSFKKIYKNSSTFFDIYSYLNERGFVLIDLYPVYKGINSELLQSDALFLNTKLFN